MTIRNVKRVPGEFEIEASNFYINATLKRQISSGIVASAVQTQGMQQFISDFNEVATVASPNDVVTLPVSYVGRTITIVNNGANTLQIYPAIGEDLGQGVNTSTTLDAGYTTTFACLTTATWKNISATGKGGDPNYTGQNESASPSATGTNSLAMGPSTLASGTNSVAIGNGVQATVDNEVHIGSSNSAKLTIQSGGGMDIVDGQHIAWGGGTNRPSIIGNKASSYIEFNVGGPPSRSYLRPTYWQFDVPLFITEQAASTDPDVAGKGQLWIKDDTPNSLYFTDDEGTDYKIGGSGLSSKTLEFVAINYAASTYVADGLAYHYVSSALNGKSLTGIHVEVIEAGITGTLSVQIEKSTERSGTRTWTTMLSVAATVDSGEFGTDTATTPSVIKSDGTEVVATTNLLRVNITGVHSGTAAKGCIVTLKFE